MSDFFKNLIEKRPEDLTLCLPMRNAFGEVVKNICTNLDEFPVYLLNNGIDDFFRATIVKEIISPLDWQFVEDFAWTERREDATIDEDEFEIVQKRFVMQIRGSATMKFM